MAGTPNGFKAVRHLNGHNTFRTQTFTVDDNNPKPIFQGHAVALSSGKVVEHTSTGAGPILGVVKACYTSTKNRPLTFNQPTTGPYIPASTRGFVDVYIDPDIVYEVVADSGMANDDIGQLGEITATGSGNPSTGISRMAMDTSTFAAQSSANVQTLPFRVLGLARVEEAPVGSGFGQDANTKVEVIVNNHVFRQSTPS